MSRRSIAFMDPRRFIRDDAWDNFFDGMSTFAVGSYSLNMYETDDHVVVEVEAPSYKPEQVDISIEDQVLTISGHYKQEDEEENRRYHYREITQRSFSRSVTLPVKVKAQDANAEFDDGIIRVTLPKAEEVKPQKIEIKTKGK